MEIYLCFIQHVLYSLKEDGKAAIVVPTGFLTAQNRSKTKKNGTEGKLSIEGAIRETIIDNKWLKGVISMPSNIFANTGTKVSIVFIDKANKEENVILIDASKLGYQPEGEKKKTVLRDDEVSIIISTFLNKEVKDDFSVKVTFDQIKEKNYSFLAGQYFDERLNMLNLHQKNLKQR